MTSSGADGGGSFLQLLGVIYLVKIIRRRRAERRLRRADHRDRAQ
jgi:hypothetical protein